MGSYRNEIDANGQIEKIMHQIDAGLGMMADDIEKMAAFKVPVDTGKLARYIKKFRVSWNHWKVTVNLDYAEYQERGARADGSRPVRNYSRPGSGPHFLEDAVNIASGRMASYFIKAKNFRGKPGSGTDFG